MCTALFVLNSMSTARTSLYIFLCFYVASRSGGSRETSDFEDNSSLVCSEGFYVYQEDITNGTTVEVCRPECGEWEEFPHSTVVAIYITEIVAAVVYILGGAVVLVLSIIQHKQMLVNLICVCVCVCVI